MTEMNAVKTAGMTMVFFICLGVCAICVGIFGIIAGPSQNTIATCQALQDQGYLKAKP